MGGNRWDDTSVVCNNVQRMGMYVRSSTRVGDGKYVEIDQMFGKRHFHVEHCRLNASNPLGIPSLVIAEGIN